MWRCGMWMWGPHRHHIHIPHLHVPHPHHIHIPHLHVPHRHHIHIPHRHHIHIPHLHIPHRHHIHIPHRHHIHVPHKHHVKANILAQTCKNRGLGPHSHSKCKTWTTSGLCCYTK